MKFKDILIEITRRQQLFLIEMIIGKLNPLIIAQGNWDVKKLFECFDEWIINHVRSFMEGKNAVYNQNKRIKQRG